MDIGCIFQVDGAYAFHALDHGASEVTAIDVRGATEGFRHENARRGDRVSYFQADLNDPSLPARTGQAEVVFCSGVIYHVPNPSLTLDCLHRLCGDVLILGSATIPELQLPHGAIYYPYLDTTARRALGYHTPPTHPKIGLDTEFRPEEGYSNYFWGLSPSCLEAMVRTAGFRVEERYRWRRAACLVCRRDAAGPPAN